MKLHTIATDLGPAALVEITVPHHPIDNPIPCGLVFWGRCGRTELLSIAANSKALWMADYDIHLRVAIVFYPEELVGKEMAIDTTAVDILCPHCGSPHYSSNGKRMWKCSGCGKQWAKSGGKRGGDRRKSLENNG